MPGYIACIFIGCVCFVIGILNTKGNINSLHSYHRKRVREQDRLPFGRMIGTGTMLCGGGMVVYGGLSVAAELTAQSFYTVIGAVLLVLSIAIGLVLCFWAMFKYNRGIF